ncbi:MAG TPA: urea ABC transporter ATP-binding subunit UrtE [Burkholderiaceae bacterium]|nr:urea ABC transporter ATP-binding subunit UrtE [Burkholderiaceae bacterium]
MLTIEGLNQYYGGSHVLRDVSMQAETGRVTAVLGRNGMGKTTLLKCLMGLLPTASGRIVFEGRDITRLKPHQRAQLGIALVPQGREIFPRLTVEENLRIAIAATGGRERGVPSWVYETFPILRQFVARRGGDLSGGQQQQLAIARALVARPRLLILDEPTEGIQPNVIQDIERVIAGLAARRTMAILLVEQYYDFARTLADRYVVLQRGEVLCTGEGARMDEDGVRGLLAV